MKKTKSQISYRAAMLSLLILFQSCVTIYKSNSLTLDKASKIISKTKVVTKDGETQKFKYISYEDSTYYGVKKKKGEILNTPLDEKNINKIKTKDKTLSTIVNIPLVFVYVIAISVAGFTSQYW